VISAPRLLLAIVSLLGCAGCESLTTTHYGVSAARGHRERVEGLLQHFAKRENLMRVAPETAGSTARFHPFVRYTGVLYPGLTLTAFDFADSIEAQFTEHRYVLGGPSGTYNELQQRLRNEFHSSFGSDVRFRAEDQ